jgi:hypothetical protein
VNARYGANDREQSEMLHYFRITAALILLLFAKPAIAADPIAVVATFSVIGDMLAKVGGDHIAIMTIVGADSDCELYQPTVADVATLASARAVFLNDLNEEFEPWLEPLLKQAVFKGSKIVVSRGVRTLTAEEEHPISGRQLPAAIDQRRNFTISANSCVGTLSRRCRAWPSRLSPLIRAKLFRITRAPASRAYSGRSR